VWLEKLDPGSCAHDPLQEHGAASPRYQRLLFSRIASARLIVFTDPGNAAAEGIARIGRRGL